MRNLQSMACCACAKKLTQPRYRLPPGWFGKYQGCVLVRIICSICIKDEDKKAAYMAD